MLNLNKKDDQAFEGLSSSAPELKFAEGDVPGKFSGYASVFGVVDNGADIVQKGAFTKSLREWKQLKGMPSMLWMHNREDPIGVWTKIEEDEKGLKVEGELILEVPKGALAHTLMKRGAANSLSIGYRTRDYKIEPNGVRLLKDLHLGEISVVSVPMLSQARVTAVKDMSEILALTDRELEQVYRDGGLSQKDAKIAVAALRKLDRREDDQNKADPQREAAAELIKSIRMATLAMKPK